MGVHAGLHPAEAAIFVVILLLFGYNVFIVKEKAVNAYQTKLYTELMALVKANEAFYHQDFTLDGKTYRIFNYRLASYTDFQQPSAIECRGIMFEVNGNDAVRLAALPMEKFFNLNENPSTIGLDLTSVEEIQEKADGSLMSTYFHNGELRLKSKGSLFSEQAIAAMKWLDRPTNKHFKNVLTLAAMEGANPATVNLEWCAPEHRIVLGYMEPSLKILNMREHETGDYVYNLITYFEKEWLVESLQVADPVAFVASIPSMTDIEGYVIRLASGQRVKVKCDWYLSLHHAKDSVNNPRRLFEAILDEGIDDLRSLFHTDPLAMRTIDEMQVKVDHIYNGMVKAVEAFYEENKTLDRKAYAIKGQQDETLKSGALSYFGLAMNKYVGKSVDYKDFIKGKWRDVGLKDTSLEKNDE
jgi:RNA ligase